MRYALLAMRARLYWIGRALVCSPTELYVEINSAWDDCYAHDLF